MLKLLIVDDEHIIREGLSKGIDWAGLDIELTPTACDAVSAMEIAKAYSPDILISDITMPGKSGIELIQEMSDLIPNLKSIIITGYDEFEYAKNAIELNVKHYLLKPVDPDVLQQKVKLLKDEIQNERKRAAEYNIFKEKFTKNIDSLKEFFLLCLLERKYENISSINDELQLFNMAQNKNTYYVATINVDNYEYTYKASTEQKKYCDYFEISDMIKKHENENMEIHTVHISSSKYAVIFCLDDCDFINPLDVIYKIQHELNSVMRLSVTIGVSNFYTDFNLLYLAYEEANEAAKYQFFAGKNQIISINDVMPEDNKILVYPTKELEKLITSVKTGDKLSCLKIIKKTFADFRTNKSITLQYIRQISIEFMSITFRTLEQMGLYPLNNSQSPLSVWQKILTIETINELEASFTEFYVEIFDCHNNKNTMTNRLIIEDIKKYLEDNYKKKLNLSDIAKNFYLSYSYLSLLFKKETNYNITEYLNIIRINKSKQLLENPTIKIYEICSMVGIDDSHYFTRIFKKQTGMSPSQYRENEQKFQSKE